MEKIVDYLIVGFGIGGACIAQQALLREKSFLVVNGDKPSATRAAGGTLNPVALRRINAVWKVDSFFGYARDFYATLEKHLSTNFIQELPIFRYFHDVEEQNNWMVASDRSDLSDFLDPTIHHFTESPWDSPMGFGKVKQSMRLNTNELLDSFIEYLKQEDNYLETDFRHEDIEQGDNYIHYKGYKAKRVIFSEGVHAKNNPFFPSHLLIPKKGEYIIVKAPNLNLEAALKGRFFIIPLGNDLYKIGATFVHGDETYQPTEGSKEQLMDAFKERISAPFELVEQIVGHRPTVKDRRPLMGSISDGSPFYFFNGLGTRGLLLAPYLSKCLIESIEDGIPLDKEMDIRRFLT